jgi:hypothetical protein
MIIEVNVPLNGGADEAKCQVEIGFSEEVKGYSGTGEFYVDEIVNIEDIPLEYEGHRTEISTRLEEMLSTGEIDDLAKTQQPDPPEIENMEIANAY